MLVSPCFLYNAFTSESLPSDGDCLNIANSEYVTSVYSHLGCLYLFSHLPFRIFPLEKFWFLVTKVSKHHPSHLEPRLKGGNLIPRASQVAQWLKNPPAMQELRVRSLGWEDPQEEGMATHSSNPAWRIPWTEKIGKL